jgi:hypothetical protein
MKLLHLSMTSQVSCDDVNCDIYDMIQPLQYSCVFIHEYNAGCNIQLLNMSISITVSIPSSIATCTNSSSNNIMMLEPYTLTLIAMICANATPLYSTRLTLHCITTVVCHSHIIYASIYHLLHHSVEHT